MNAETIAQDAPHIQFRATITLGNILSMVVILCTAGGYIWNQSAYQATQDRRLVALETLTVQQQIKNDELSALISKEIRVLDLLEQRLQDFPLHRHENGKVIYPGKDPFQH